MKKLTLSLLVIFMLIVDIFMVIVIVIIIPRWLLGDDWYRLKSVEIRGIEPNRLLETKRLEPSVPMPMARAIREPESQPRTNNLVGQRMLPYQPQVMTVRFPQPPDYPLLNPSYPPMSYPGDTGSPQPFYPPFMPSYPQGHLPPSFYLASVPSYPTGIMDRSDSILRRPSLIIQGMRGSLVKHVQTALLQNGFHPGTIDSIYGDQTSSVVKAFQIARGLFPTGEVDLETIQVLGLDLTQE